MSDIEPFANVESFFVEHVTEAMRLLRVEARAETQGYLVHLLSAFAVSHQAPSLSESLAGMLQGAMQATGPDRIARLRDLGDLALFICGFFPDSFDRRGLSRTYVIAMGGRAYLVVGNEVRDRGHGQLFAELGDRFHDMARVLDEVRERTAMCTDGAVIRLYERWRDSGSPTLSMRLQRRGVYPAIPSQRRRLH